VRLKYKITLPINGCYFWADRHFPLAFYADFFYFIMIGLRGFQQRVSRVAPLSGIEQTVQQFQAPDSTPIVIFSDAETAGLIFMPSEHR
jgi:hypothetical protein